MRVQFFVILTLEGEFSTQKSKKQNSERPNVSRRPRILYLTHNFRSHVTRCSAENFHFALVWNAGTEPKVDHFYDGFSFIEQNILQLYVSMSDIPLMTIVNRLYNLSPKVFCLELRHLPVRFHFQISMQTASIDVLHENKYLLMRFKCFIEFANVWMI